MTHGTAGMEVRPMPSAAASSRDLPDTTARVEGAVAISPPLCSLPVSPALREMRAREHNRVFPDSAARRLLRPPGQLSPIESGDATLRFD